MTDLLKEYVENGSKSGFWCNKSSIVQAFADGELYVQAIEETEQDFESGWPEGLRETSWPGLFGCIIPAFCWYSEKDSIRIIWTRKDWRLQGVAKQFVNHFKVSKVSNIVPASKGFWNKLNVAEINDIMQ